jgi:hypothetical protein
MANRVAKELLKIAKELAGGRYISAAAVYHGSSTDGLTSFELSGERFALLGKGAYFYKNAASCRQYGEHLYKANTNGFKIAKKGFVFNASQSEELLGKLGVVYESLNNIPVGVSAPVWWGTDGFDYFNLDRKSTIRTVTEYMMRLGYDGMTAIYPNGGEVVVIWRNISRINLQQVK